MATRVISSKAGRWCAGAVAIGVGAYAAMAAAIWMRYGHPAPARDDQRDRLLDQFMPVYDVVTRHERRITAPPEDVLAAARQMDMLGSPLARAIFRTRELVLGATGAPRAARRVMEEVTALGWGVLADVPGREVVVGAVTRPWEADVTFRAVPPEAFAAFAEPGYVQIAWTLRADPDGTGGTIFRTETRARATDAAARARFRRYWACFSPGMRLIRWTMLAPLAKAAELRAEPSDRRRLPRHPSASKEVP
jgi:hypothetical protein